MQKETWSQQWLQPCLGRHARKTSLRRPVARLIISSRNFRVSWKPVNPQECVMGESLPKYHEDHIAGEGDNSLEYFNFGTQIYSYASSHEDTRSKSSSG